MLTREETVGLGNRGEDGAVAGVGVGQIIVSYDDGVTVLTLVGEHDMSNADQLLATIRDLGRGVVIVLSQTEFRHRAATVP